MVAFCCVTIVVSLCRFLILIAPPLPNILISNNRLPPAVILPLTVLVGQKLLLGFAVFCLDLLSRLQHSEHDGGVVRTPRFSAALRRHVSILALVRQQMLCPHSSCFF